MPVFRGFSEVKGVKIPKIVTYHTTVKTMFMHRFGAIFRREKRGRNTSRKGGVTDVMQQALRKFFERGFSELEKEKKQTAKRGLNLCRNRLRKKHLKAVPERCAELPVLWKNTRQKAEKPKVGYHIIYKKKLISVLFGNKAAEKDDGRTRLSEFRKFETGEKNGGFGRKRSKYE